MASSKRKPKFKVGDVVKFVNTTGTQDWADPEGQYLVSGVVTDRPIDLDFHEDNPDWFQIYYQTFQIYYPTKYDAFWEENLELVYHLTDDETKMLDSVVKKLKKHRGNA